MNLEYLDKYVTVLLKVWFCALVIAATVWLCFHMRPAPLIQVQTPTVIWRYHGPPDRVMLPPKLPAVEAKR